MHESGVPVTFCSANILLHCAALFSALLTGWVHPTININNPEDGVDPTVVCAGVKQQHPVKVALSNSFGFGGHNSCVIFKKME
jgi:3-oxoacyl-[acyl-carrier-protein] synthase II